MSEEDDTQSEMDEELAAFDFPAEEVKNMSYKEKKELVSTFRLSMHQSSSTNQEKVVARERTPTSPMDELQLRLQKAGVSITSLATKSGVDDDSDDVVVIKEFESPHTSSLRRPPIHFSPAGKNMSPAAENSRTTPTRRVTPSPTTVSRVTPSPTSLTSRVARTVTSGTPVRARKKIEVAESAKDRVVSPVTPKDTEQYEVMPSRDYVKRRAEIFALNPHSCVDTALSTLAKMSSLPKRNNKSIPFFYSEHALSLNMDDYTALFLRKFGCSWVPLEPGNIEEYDKEPSEVNESSNAQNELSDFPSLEEAPSNSKYNLRQRTGIKRTATDFELTISDDEDSDSIIPNKKVYCNEKDDPFLPREEAKTSTHKPRLNKLRLTTTKIVAEQNSKACSELVTVDSDNSSDFDVPGKEVCVPKLQYSPVANNETSKWKLSKTKVSAVPKGQGDMDDAYEAVSEIQSVKPRQARVKPSEVIKPRPISGKNRRAALAEGSSTRKSARGKQANKKEPESDVDDDEEQEEEMLGLFPCPLCKEEFPQAEIQAHVNACCDETARENMEGECPVCYKKFLLEDLPDHSSMCEGRSEN